MLEPKKFIASWLKTVLTGAMGQTTLPTKINKHKRHNKKNRVSSNVSFREPKIENLDLSSSQDYSRLRDKISSQVNYNKHKPTISKPGTTKTKFEAKNNPKISISYIKQKVKSDMKNDDQIYAYYHSLKKEKECDYPSLSSKPSNTASYKMLEAQIKQRPFSTSQGSHGSSSRVKTPESPIPSYSKQAQKVKDQGGFSYQYANK